MQNRYAGDVGDFMKLGLLRHLAAPPAAGGAGLSVGLNWYLTPDEGHNADGKHIAYLLARTASHRSLEACDGDLMGRLAQVVANGRSVEALEACGALPPGACTHRAMLARALSPGARRRWHCLALDALAGAEVVFADPDNGIRTSVSGSKPEKYALVAELADYAERGQSLIVYQHADRSAGAESQARRRLLELAHGVGQPPVGAIIARRGTCRFFLVTAAESHRVRLASSLTDFAVRWARHVDLLRLDGCSGPEPEHEANDRPSRAPPRAREAAPVSSAAQLSRADLAGSLRAVAPMEFRKAVAFIAAVPAGRWTSYKDVATAAGNERGAQAASEWCRRRGDEIPHVYRVIRSDGFVAEGFRAAGAGIPEDAPMARELLRSEGVGFDTRGRASPGQRFRVDQWPATRA